MVDFLKKHKTKLIATFCVIIALAGAWALGSGYEKPEQGYSRITPPEATQSASISASGTTPKASPDGNKAPTSKAATPDPKESETPTPEPSESPDPNEAPSPEPSSTPSPEPTQLINPDTGKDKYQTSLVPEGNPLPVEPENATLTSIAYTCTLSVRCDTILGNIKNLDPEKVELVPEDGVILETITVTFYEGESVFNVLQREMRRANIHMEFVNTPIYNSAYIEGISNLYEFDCGELSGWMYKVNDWFPNYGCSRYQLKQGDVIEWIYTCDLGRDIGGYNVLG